MRNLVYAINLSADGCCDHTKFRGSEEMLDYHLDLMSKVDLIVYGRKTYELMFPYWPDAAKDPSSTKADVKFAEALTALDKVVFSRSLNSAEANTRIAANLEDEIRKLKQGTGKGILTGGVSVPEQLMALGLVDEFHFFIHPVLVGEGRRLLDSTRLQENLNLKLVGSEKFKSGALALHYLLPSGERLHLK
ncbi:MAG: dihydrofolate reductase family protein [Bacteroidota bacterium]|nr:dihydrofolate reductase family protein [Bacteroidota bacterium]MDP4245941.1 dihydrofolate reductase family protein [Bacteroidota bacterium]MDP4254681.1 dihydrofolate reductase family protein [Bacteroidota bacterium]MDP4260260.1 dihydrofolate reductase family protein [Bacteroidota bacterium]